MSSIPPPPPNMGPPPGYTPYGGDSYSQPAQSGKATASLVLGIIGIFICPIVLSVLAIVFGVQSRNEITNSGGRLKGHSMATAGLVLGIVGLVLMPVWFIILSNTN
jgi:hypothetical protein